MIPPAQFLEHVIRPTLYHLAVVEPRLGGRAAEQLMLGTAIAESALKALAQWGGGPALSFFQIEPTTFHDIYDRYLRARARFLIAIQDLRVPALTPLEQLAGNPFFACGIARMKFWMAPEPLPEADDIDALGRYWKSIYNTAGGAGTASHWTYLYRKHVLTGETP